jgi:hypothetical protein
MKRVANLVGGSLLVLASLLLSLAVCEVSLRIFFPDLYFDAFTATNDVDATKIWAPPVNTANYFRHPDTGEKILLVRNNLGIRLSYDILAERLAASRNVAFFGDSFTANIRLPSQYSFPEVLRALLDKTAGTHEVMNFGVDGYGPGQSFLRYRELDPAIRKNLQDVYFVFYINDLSDIVSDGIAYFDAGGQLKLKPGLPFFPSWLRGLTRLHMTYFFVDAYSYLKGARGAVGEAVKKAGNETMFTAAATASTTGDAGLDGSIGLLNALLLQWQSEVEADGGVFHVVVIPRPDHHFMLAQFDGRLRILDLFPVFSRMLPDYDYTKIKFHNDDHWDELGNLLAAVALYQDLSARGSALRLTAGEIHAALEKYYKNNGKWQPQELGSLQFAY